MLRARAPIASLLAIVALLPLAAAAQARGHRVPYGKLPRDFIGTEFGEYFLTSKTPAQQDVQIGQMAASGIETMRVPVYWENIEPTKGTFTWFQTDSAIGMAAEHGIDALPMIYDAPVWASTQPSMANAKDWPDPTELAGFMTAMIGRYGPAGSFWAANPQLKPLPVRAWQIWNEPEFDYFYGDRNFHQSFPLLMKAAYQAVHQADPGAVVVMAGLANTTNYYSWNDLAAFYKNGVKPYFDVLAINPFGVNFTDVTYILNKVRHVMAVNHDSRKPIWLTELTWLASKGKIHPSDNLGLETTTAVQQASLKHAYLYFAKHKEVGVRRVYWYSWVTSYKPIGVLGSQPSFEYAGLNAGDANSITPMHLLSVFRAVARKLEGCSYTLVAGVCR